MSKPIKKNRRSKKDRKKTRMILILRRNALKLFFMALIVLTMAGLTLLSIDSQIRHLIHLIQMIIFLVFFFDMMRVKRTSHNLESRNLRAEVERIRQGNDSPFGEAQKKYSAKDFGRLVRWRRQLVRLRRILRMLGLRKLAAQWNSLNQYIFRVMLLIMFLVLSLVGWGFVGDKLKSVIYPGVRRMMQASNAPIDAWIAPPAYTRLQPLLIATPAGQRFADGPALDIPSGSMIKIHMADADTGQGAPTLHVNGNKVEFQRDIGGDYVVMARIDRGESIKITRGGGEVASWQIKIRDSGQQKQEPMPGTYGKRR